MPEPYSHAFARNLHLLNCSELHHLTRAALDSPHFTLTEGFRSTLSREFGVEVPEDAFAGIGYRIDWLHGALKMTFEPAADHVYEGRGELLQATQETIDLLVAWDEPESAHVVMLQTRGSTQAANRQFRNCMKHIGGVFGPEGDRWPGVQPHIGLASLREPPRISAKDVPVWALRDGLPIWIRVGTRDPLCAITRCDDVGTPAATGEYWTLRQI